KNFGADSINFFNHNLQVILHITDPSSVTRTFSKSISSGILASGAFLTILFDSTYNMSSPGNYLFNAYTVLAGDNNISNDSMPAASVTVNTSPSSNISPLGPIFLCIGSFVTLNATGG